MSNLTDQRPCFRLPPPEVEMRFGVDRLKPLLAEILAFWALWHCRHARPPDELPIPR